MYSGRLNNLVRALSIYFNAWTSTQNLPTMVFELKKRSIGKLDRAVILAFSLACVVYTLVSLAGYKVFGSTVDSDLLKSFPRSVYVTIARIGISLCLITCYPLQMYPCKKAISNILFSKDAVECSNATYYTLVFSLASVVYLIVIFVEDLSVVFTFISATTCMLVGYVVPTYFYIQVFKEMGCSCEMVLAWVIFTLSICLIPILVSAEIIFLVS